MNSIYTFEQPHPTGGYSVVFITSNQILRHMKQSRDIPPTLSDEEIIREFVDIYWATKVSTDNG